jgi:hypothetical protein
MKKFRNCLVYFFRRLSTKLNWIIFFLVLCVSFFALCVSINEMRSEELKKKEFLKTEAEQFKLLRDYKLYAATGINVLFFSGTPGILYSDSGLYSDLMSRVDAVYTLKIFENAKGDSVFAGKSFLAFDFSRIILLFGMIFSIFYGYYAFRQKDFFKMMAGILSVGKTFRLTILSNITIMACILMILYGFASIVLLIFGIRLTFPDYKIIMGHFVVALAIWIFIYSAGLLIGRAFKNRIAGITSIWVTLGILVLILPSIIDRAVHSSADSTANYRSDYNKIKILSDFEKRAKDEIVKLDKSNLANIRKIYIERFWGNEFQDIMKLEMKNRNELAAIAKKSRDLSIWNPVSFYVVTSSEVSGKGLENYVAFYDYAIEMNRKFARFIIDRVYYNDPNVIVNFIKGEENVFPGKSRLPSNFIWGIVITLAYSFIFFLISFQLFKRYLFHVEREAIEKMHPFDLELRKDNLNIFYTGGGETQRNFLFSILSGKIDKLVKNGFNGKVTVDSNDIRDAKMERDFVYILKEENLPGDFKVKDFITFFSSICETPTETKRKIIESAEIKPIENRLIETLKREEKFDILMSMTYLAKKQIYLIDDIAALLPGKCVVKLNGRLNEFKNEGVLAIYIISLNEIKTNAGESKKEESCGLSNWNANWNNYIKFSELDLDTNK